MSVWIIYIYNMFRTYIVWFVSDSHVIHIWFFKFLHIFVSNHLRIVGHPMSVFASPWPASLGSELGIEQPVFCSPFESSFRCLWKMVIFHSFLGQFTRGLTAPGCRRCVPCRDHRSKQMSPPDLWQWCVRWAIRWGIEGNDFRVARLAVPHIF